MEIVNLPQLRMVRGVAFAQAWQMLDEADAPTDLSGWSATFVVRKGSIDVLSAPLNLSANGMIQLSLTAAQVSSIPDPVATYQAVFTDPTMGVAEVWRGQVLVQ